MTASPSPDDAVARSLAALRARSGRARGPRLAVLLGTGWQGLAERLHTPLAWGYDELPAFPALNVQGHAAQLLWGRLDGPQGPDLMLLCGRQHAYEHGNVAAMKGAIHTLAAWGVQVLVQTNAAGSLDPAMRPGALMLASDHLNLVQASPLLHESGTRRFVDLREAYCARLRQRARAAVPALHEGVYAWVLGPQFETPAEIRMLQRLGAQAVGMSTVPETILARHAGLRVLALSLITNMGCGLDGPTAAPLSHEHTLAAAQRDGQAAVQALVQVLKALADDDAGA
ncbi:inosine guanosine and xanthosine phosphorylase family protein [Burkholderiales bacterium JOSHI_001]|nr:inosine guanosine and xanthosine phosphorylase family protein [Burkholderiales bacterium JOSHI_001]